MNPFDSPHAGGKGRVHRSVGRNGLAGRGLHRATGNLRRGAGTPVRRSDDPLGVIKLVGFFSKDLYRLAFQYDCIFGALLIALGATVLLRPGGLLTVLCVALGLYILADGLFRMRMAWEARAFGIRLWWLIMTAAAVSGLCGLVLMFRPAEGGQALMILFGVTLVSESILNICTMLTAVKIIRHQMPDAIETEEYEVNHVCGGRNGDRPESED